MRTSTTRRSVVLTLLLAGVAPMVPPASAATTDARDETPTGASSRKSVSARAEERITVRRFPDTEEGHQPGGGLIRPENGIRAVSSVSRDFIAKQAPSATAFQLVTLLPGANVATSDPLGFSPSTNITVRGLNGDAIGYVLEGMPLNDIAYYGGYPSQFADSENYDQVALAQGAADLDSPVLNAAGGLMSLRFRDPEKTAGGYASASYGSYNTNREFLRLETGEIGRTGVRGFISYSHGATNNWRGPGRDTRQHVDFKFLKEWGEGNRASVLGSWNSTITSWYPQVTQQDFKQYGVGGANNLARSYNPANAAAGTDYWRLWRDPERTLYVGAPVHLRLSERWSLDTTPYSQFAYGNFPGGSTLTETGLYNGTQPIAGAVAIPGATDGTATVRANYNQRSYRSGFTATLHYKRGWNDFLIGYWYDYTDNAEQQSFTPVNAAGYAPDIWAEKRRATVLLANGRQLLAGDDHTISQANALFIGDHMDLLNKRLLIDAGFKMVMLTRQGTNGIPGPQYHANASYAEPLPRLGVRWRIDPHHQLFFNATTNFRTPDETAFYNTYDPTSGALEVAAATNTRPEYSITEELGYRYTGRWVIGSVTLFNYNFTNRQISTLVSQNGALIQSTLNAGGQTSRGVDVELGTRPWHHLTAYASGEYLHATIDNDIASDGDLLPTRGKTAVRSPTLQAAASLSYDDGHLFANATVNYTGHQYASFMNDERLASHTTGNLALGYRFADAWRLHTPTLKMNFINITNEHYLSGIATPTLNAKDTTGVYGTAISGSAADYYIGGGFAALFTASTGF